MGLKHYGVLKGRAKGRLLGTGESPRYQIHVEAAGVDFRVAVNVKSKLNPPELLYLTVDDFRHPLTGALARLDAGFSELPGRPDGLAIDYVRSGLFDQKLMTALPHEAPGPDNDLNEKIDTLVRRAIGDGSAWVYAFGDRWGPSRKSFDPFFGFTPGNGLHDVHMNQGNDQQFRVQDGAWQDGALFFQFPDGTGERWAAVFLAFQSQSWATDTETGHARAAREHAERRTPRQPDLRHGSPRR
jgi:uncharacterized protein YukJ